MIYLSIKIINVNKKTALMRLPLPLQQVLLGSLQQSRSRPYYFTYLVMLNYTSPSLATRVIGGIIGLHAST